MSLSGANRGRFGHDDWRIQHGYIARVAYFDWARSSLAFLLDKINARAIAVGITALATVMLFGYSVASAPWHIYLLAALSGTIITAGARLFVSVIITNWFNLERGFAVSLALCGSAFGGAIAFAYRRQHHRHLWLALCFRGTCGYLPGRLTPSP